MTRASHSQIEFLLTKLAAEFDEDDVLRSQVKLAAFADAFCKHSGMDKDAFLGALLGRLGSRLALRSGLPGRMGGRMLQIAKQPLARGVGQTSAFIPSRSVAFAAPRATTRAAGRVVVPASPPFQSPIQFNRMPLMPLERMNPQMAALSREAGMRSYLASELSMAGMAPETARRMTPQILGGSPAALSEARFLLPQGSTLMPPVNPLGRTIALNRIAPPAPVIRTPTPILEPGATLPPIYPGNAAA